MVIGYLEENWTANEINSFISRNPKQYLYSKKKEVYRAVVTKQISLYYRIKLKEIELLVFWDSRQNPAKLKV